MPNTGRPSQACHSCRKRRIKVCRCDLTRPHCFRCLRSGYPCPGYRNEEDTRFRVETTASFRSNIGKDRRSTSWTSRSIIPAGNEYSSNTTVSILPSTDIEYAALHITGVRYEPDGGFATSSTYYSPPLQYLLADSRTEHSIPLLIHQFSSHIAIGSAPDSFIALSHIMSNAKQGSPLYYVCKTLGCSYLLSATRSRDIIGQAESYANTVAAINSALQDSEECKADGTLLSVWLLRLYTVLWSTQDGIGSIVVTCESDSHIEGMLQLVRLRGVSQFLRPEGQDLFWNVLFTLLHRTLMTGGNPSSEILNWINEIYCHGGQPSYGTALVGMFSYHCVRICSTIQGLIKLGDVSKLLSDSRSIINDIQTATQLTSHNHLDTKKVQELVSAPSQHADKLVKYNISLNLYQSEMKMRLLCHGVEFLRYISDTPVCTSQQKDNFSRSRDHYIRDFQDEAYQVLSLIISMWDMESIVFCDELKQRKSGTRSAEWTDVLRILNPLALIAQSSISIGWQKTAANGILGLMYKRLHFF
ncbi:hypothetical protein BGW36DRAFT_111188 [Talaromyces proteolyticus]|uniref:Zn(2)-C6 fungal-type domain-containing protein n=1 Tax=Talaromyces proteolyticus TaxID=1131652 RepID=A0AAD4PZ05_9EURO|nr:uncharacterized protein BGW36DRAFT_111188 [Talaromyces proteolyticus]KAH8702110.1 hypothetical protein BGW36DRAFT_111188 [Talaromyces proteolyticus]